jgi:hypothetical protein
MKIYSNMPASKLIHTIDRVSEINNAELKYIAKLFDHVHPIVQRKSNGWWTPLGMVKAKNLHWYK